MVVHEFVVYEFVFVNLFTNDVYEFDVDKFLVYEFVVHDLITIWNTRNYWLKEKSWERRASVDLENLWIRYCNEIYRV